MNAFRHESVNSQSDEIAASRCDKPHVRAEGIPRTCRCFEVFAPQVSSASFRWELGMSDLPSHIRGYRETVRAKKSDQHSRALEAWESIKSERQALDERTAKLRALRLGKGS